MKSETAAYISRAVAFCGRRRLEADCSDRYYSRGKLSDGLRRVLREELFQRHLEAIALRADSLRLNAIHSEARKER